MVDLSVIILSYNTKDITLQSLESLIKSLQNCKKSYEILIVDNASTDGSAEAIQRYISILSFPNIRLQLIREKQNWGFSKGNNIALKQAEGKYILYLNSDVIIDSVQFDDLISYLDSQKDIGALTVKVNLPTGGIDPASHRGFPTVWRSFTYFSKLEQMFGNMPLFSKLLGGYHLLHFDLNSTHEIDSPSGAFFLSPKAVLDKLKGFDETFFMYGEDLDLAYRIKELGYKVVYYPVYAVTHLKYKSGLQTQNTNTRSKTRNHFYDAMKIFYKKHYETKYPWLINQLVYAVINKKIKR